MLLILTKSTINFMIKDAELAALEYVVYSNLFAKNLEDVFEE